MMAKLGKNAHGVQLIAMHKELSNCQTTVLFRLVLEKEKMTTLVTGSGLDLVF